MPFSNFLNTALDSFKLRILSEKVILTDKGKSIFNDKRYIYNVTQDKPEELFKKNSYISEDLKGIGISLRFSKGKIQTGFKDIKMKQDCIFILINSKIVKKDYFKAICNNTIQEVYNVVMNEDLFSCSYKDFLDGHLTDCDIKTDIKMPLKEAKIFLDEMKKNTTSGKKFRRKDNEGLQFSQRSSASRIDPFVKFYYKMLELLYESGLFSDYFLKGQDKEYLRLEATIKDQGHFQSLLKSLKLGKREFTLRNMLELESNTKLNILKLLLSKYNPAKKPRKYSLPPNNDNINSFIKTTIYQDMKKSILLGATFKDYIEDLKEMYLEGRYSKTQYYRNKKQAFYLYEILKNDKDLSSKIHKNETINFLLN